MAILSSDDLSLEVKFECLDKHNFVNYKIFLRCNSDLLLNPKIIKPYWQGNKKKARDYFYCESDTNVGDTFIPFLEEVLFTNEPDYWLGDDFDIIIAVYPEMFFPFLRPLFSDEIVYEKPEVKEKRVAKEKLKEKKFLPDDLIQVICFVDAYNLGKNQGGYTGDGAALILTVKRFEIEAFLAKLKDEYNFMKKGLAESSSGVFPSNYYDQFLKKKKINKK